ncbi:MAG: type II secretion system protein GspL [Porticoccus sp.]|nr:type II secretion system protein GspL [Porticoccus sp.]
MILTLFFEPFKGQQITFLLTKEGSVIRQGCSLLEELSTELSVELSAELSDISACTTTVIIPGEQVTSWLVDIPKGSRRHFHKALPYLLEDELAAPVESLHFAVGETNADGQVLCAVMDKQRLQGYLEQLKEVGIHPTTLIPDYWTLPPDINGQHVEKPQVAQYKDRALIRLPDNTGMTLPLSMVTDVLPETGSDSNTHNTESVQAWHPAPDHICPLNVLQGEFSPASATTPEIWLKPLGIACSISLVLILSYFLASGWYFNQQAEELASQSTAAYKALFPTDTRIVNIRHQMKAHLNQSGTHQNQNLFFDLLSVLSTAIAANTSEKAVIRHIRFEHDDATLQLEIQTQSMAYAHNLQSQVKAEGISMEVLSANSNDEGVLARLRLKSETP